MTSDCYLCPGIECLQNVPINRRVLRSRWASMLPSVASPNLSRRVDAHDEDLHAISDTVIEIREDVAEIKMKLAEHSATLAQVAGDAEAACTRRTHMARSSRASRVTSLRVSAFATFGK